MNRKQEARSLHEDHRATLLEHDHPVVRPRPGIALLLAGAAIAIGLAAALLQPWDPTAPGAQRRTPPDELSHIAYVHHLVLTRRLPVLTSGAGLYEAHQPPLYYISTVPAKLLGTAIDPRTRGSKHPSDGEVLAERIWSVLLAAGVVVSCYLVACVVFPRSPTRQIAAPLFALLLPGHMINLAAVTNDGLAELLCALALWVALGIMRTPTLGLLRYVSLGAIIGLALLTKTSCLFLMPTALIVVLLTCSPVGTRSCSWRQFAVRAAVVIAVAGGLWTGWMAHNLSHYPGDPLVTRTFVEIFGKDRATPEMFFALGLSFFGYVRLVFTWTYLSFWGVFGEAAVFMGGWYYAVGTLVGIVACVGIVAEARRWRTANNPGRYLWSVLALAGILVVLQFLKFNMEFFQAQARYLFPAIAPIACAVAAGVDRAALLAAGRCRSVKNLRWIVLAACGMLMLVMLAAALVEVAARGLTTPPPAWIGLPSFG